MLVLSNRKLGKVVSYLDLDLIRLDQNRPKSDLTEIDQNWSKLTKFDTALPDLTRLNQTRSDLTQIPNQPNLTKSTQLDLIWSGLILCYLTFFKHIPTKPYSAAVHFLLSRFFPDFILILSWFYLHFILILSRIYPNFIQILSRFYLDKIWIKSR